MKLEPHLPPLPSIGELLEHPRVKGLVERVNRSTLAQRAAGFLDELRTSLAARTGAAEMPSVAHLAERLARRLLGEPALEEPVINATGVVLGDPELAPPLSERALQAMFQLAAEYRRRGLAALSAAPREACETLGGESAHLTGSLSGAITLVMAALASPREVVICREQQTSDADAIDWSRLAAQSGAVIRWSADIEKSISPGAAAILRAPDAEGVSLTELKPLALGANACLIDVAPAAGTIDPARFGFDSLPTIADRLAAGADLVVVDGEGLLGGPSCGLIVGRRALVERLAQHPLASLTAIHPLARAALDASLRAYRDDAAAEVIHQLPVWQLLSAPLANLQQRAERLAPQMAEGADVASAESRQLTSAWRRWGPKKWSAPSWGIAIRPRDGDAAKLSAQLLRGAHPIAAREENGEVTFDLRSVFPRWDQALVASVAGAGTASSENA